MADYTVITKAAIQGPVPLNVAGQTLSPVTAPSRAIMNNNAGWPVPVFDYGMAFSDVASSGLRQFSGYVREEFLPQLVGRQGARTYREMLDNSAPVGSVMFAITSTMRKIDWRTESADDSPAAIEMQEFADGLKDDMSHTWPDFINESLSMLGYGYAPHEIVYKRRLGRNPGNDPTRPGRQLPQSKFDDGCIGWRRLPLRGQDTIIKWFFGESGEILGLTQQPWIGPLVDLPIEKMLLFRPNSHKNNPEGRSILRTAYRAYYFVKRLEEQEAILFERLSGLPVVSVPNELLEAAALGDANASAKLEAFKGMARNVRIDEQMGIVLPSDCYPGPGGGASPERQYKFELIGPQATRNNANSDVAINRYTINIMTSVMADFLMLGHEARGTQALSQSKTDMFFQAMEGFLDSNAEVMNRYALPRLWDFNGFNPDLLPVYKPDLPQRLDLDVLSNFILRLSQSGMPLFPDPELEEFIRDAAGFPDVSDADAAQAVAQAAKPGTPQEIQKRERDLLAMVKGSILRRIRVMNTAKGSSRIRKRRKKAA